MHRLKHLEGADSLPRPCDYFDMIGGVGTGGVIALMLGRLRMPIDLAIEKYVKFSKKVYSNTKIFSTGSEKFKTSVFISGMEEILGSAGFPADILMQEDGSSCKSFVVALPSVNITPRIFRSYEARAHQGLNCRVVEAAHATNATPEFFKPASISYRGLSETFVGGGHLGHSNPTGLVLQEAELLFGASRLVACLVSIGAGHPGHVSWQPTKLFGQKLVDVLLQISSNYEQLAEEYTRRYIHMPGVFYRLSVEQGLQRMALDDWNRQDEILAHSTIYLQNAAVTQKVDNLVNALHDGNSQKVTLGELNGPRPSSNAEQGSNNQNSELLPIVAPPSDLFMGRKEIITQLEEFFNGNQLSLEPSQRCFVLYGLGGAGKTQIMRKFCHDYGKRFSMIYMIDAYSQASIEQLLVMVAQNAQLAQNTPKAALEWLCHQKTEWLMIFDNADDPKVDLWKFIPNCSHGNILITSRNEQSKKYARKNFIKVGEMSDEDSLAILFEASQRHNASDHEHAIAKELVQELGHLALAIVQAGSYLYLNQHVGFSQYLENIKENKSRYLSDDEENMDRHEHSIFATWNLSYQELDDKAKSILMMCSVLHYSKIPVSILKRAWENLKKNSEPDNQNIRDVLGSFTTKEGNWDSSIQEKAIKALQSYSLVEIAPGVGDLLLEVHPLVHAWSYESLSEEEQVYAQDCAQQLFVSITGKLEEAEDVNGQALKAHSEVSESSHPYAIEAMANTAATFRRAGKLEKAEDLEWQILKAHTTNFGRNDSRTTLAIVNLIETLQTSEKLEEAEKLEQQLLETFKEVYGSKHPFTIGAMTAHGITLRRTGRLQEAEDLECQVLKTRIEAFGSKHPDTIIAIGNLAATLKAARKLEEAEDFAQQFLSARLEAFGSTHPDTIIAMGNLAGVLEMAGKLEEAENLQDQALQACIATFESSHPETIQARANLAVTMRKTGKLEKAEDLEQQVLKACVDKFGESNHNTIRAKANLAVTLETTGKLKEVEELEQQVLKARMEVFGDKHPDTLLAMANHAVTLQRAGKLQEAEDLEQQVLRTRTEILGNQNPDTMQAMANLAGTLKIARKLEEAEYLEQKVLTTRKELFGDSHVDTIRAMANIAVTLQKAGKLEQAEEIEQHVLKARIEAFGNSHPDTIKSMANSAVTLRKAGKLNEAEGLERQVLAYRATFGNRHPDTIQAMGNLAITLQSAGKLEEAEDLGNQALEACIATLESGHPNTIQARADLAVTLQKAGRLQEAQELEQQVLLARTEALGSKNIHTIQAMENLAVTFQKAGKLEEAQSLEQEVLTAYREVLGDKHSDTIQAMENLVVTLQKAGKLEEAEGLRQQVLKAHTEALKSAHSSTVQPMIAALQTAES
ncbi:Nephrocystin-3 [Termitomyces sp. J132]|nr:Nephrocystin-3 [Termitomyces sp. J132]